MNAQDAVTEEYAVLTVEAHTPTFQGEPEAVAIPTELDKIVGRQSTRRASTVLARFHSPYDGSKIRGDRMSSGAQNTRNTQSGNIIVLYSFGSKNYQIRTKNILLVLTHQLNKHQL